MARRGPEGADKLAVTRAVEKAASAIPFRLALRVIGLTSARYHAWQRGGAVCELGDQSSCPKTLPGQLTAEEVREMRDMVTSGDFRHMSIRALALHAQRIGVWVNRGPAQRRLYEVVLPDAGTGEPFLRWNRNGGALTDANTDSF